MRAPKGRSGSRSLLVARRSSSPEPSVGAQPCRPRAASRARRLSRGSPVHKNTLVRCTRTPGACVCALAVGIVLLFFWHGGSFGSEAIRVLRRSDAARAPCSGMGRVWLRARPLQSAWISFSRRCRRMLVGASPRRARSPCGSCCQRTLRRRSHSSWREVRGCHGQCSPFDPSASQQGVAIRSSFLRTLRH